MAYRQQRIRALAAERLGFHEAYRAPARIKTEDTRAVETPQLHILLRMPPLPPKVVPPVEYRLPQLPPRQRLLSRWPTWWKHKAPE